MSEQPSLVRQWTLLRTLCARHYGATVKELSETVGTSIKTIRRDLETFQQAGFPLEEMVEDFGRKKWRIDPSKTGPGLSFAFDEAISLYLARHLLEPLAGTPFWEAAAPPFRPVPAAGREPLAGTPFWEAAQRAFKKIRATLGAQALRYVERFGGVFYQTMVGVGNYAKQAKTIDQLVLGIENHRAVFIKYQSLQATEPTTYDCYPYGLVYHRGAALRGRLVTRPPGNSPLEG